MNSYKHVRAVTPLIVTGLLQVAFGVLMTAEDSGSPEDAGRVYLPSADPMADVDAALVRDWETG